MDPRDQEVNAWTLEIFFEKFELFADAPNAVAKMRELVLQFGMCGGRLYHTAQEEEPDQA